MRGPPAPFLLLLFSHLISNILAKSQISCYHQLPPRQRLADCDAALEMIPNGVHDLRVDLGNLHPADRTKPIALEFAHPGRNRTYLIPATFPRRHVCGPRQHAGIVSAPAGEGGLGHVLQGVAEREEGGREDRADVLAADAEVVVVWMGAGVDVGESVAVSLHR